MPTAAAAAARGALLALLLAALALPGLAQFASSKPKVYPRREDVKYIKCQVCELLAKNAYKQVKEMAKAATPSQRLTEEKVLERVEKLTNPLKDEGEWVTKIDLVEQGSKLVAKEMDEVGECGVECKTVARAAQDILDEHDTDIAEALFVGKKGRAQFTNWLCYDLASACSSKPPPLPKGRKPGEPWKPADAEKLKMDKMMASMEESGMRGNMMTRDEAMAKYMREQGGDDDDDEDVGLPPFGDEGHGAGDSDHPVNKLASAAMETGEALLNKAKDAAAPLLEGAAAGIEKAKEEARKIWDKFTAEQKAKDAGEPAGGSKGAAEEL